MNLNNYESSQQKKITTTNVQEELYATTIEQKFYVREFKFPLKT